MRDPLDYQPKDCFLESILFKFNEFKILTFPVKDTNKFSLIFVVKVPCQPDQSQGRTNTRRKGLTDRILRVRELSLSLCSKDISKLNYPKGLIKHSVKVHCLCMYTTHIYTNIYTCVCILPDPTKPFIHCEF